MGRHKRSATAKKFVPSVESIESRLLLSTFNVKSYGALGNGVANDAVAIQKAINAAAPGHDTVYLPAGTYGIKTTLFVGSDVTLIGDGATSVVTPLAGWSSPYGGLVINRDGTDSRITIRSLAFQGNRANAPGLHDLSFRNVTNLTVNNVSLNTAAANGIYVTGTSSYITIVHVSASGNAGSGIMLASDTAIQHATVSDSLLVGNGRGGVDLGSNGYNITVTNNQCLRNIAYGIFADGGNLPLNSQCTISGNTVTGSGVGIIGGFAQHLTISNNTVSGCDTGLSLANCSDVTVTGNSIHDDTGYGINLDVMGPYINDPPYGIDRATNPMMYLVGDAARQPLQRIERVTITGNVIQNNGQGRHNTAAIRGHNLTACVIKSNVISDTQTKPTQTAPYYTEYAPVKFTAWADGVNYVVGPQGTGSSLVTMSGVNYQCVLAHTSRVNTQPGTGTNWTTYWVLSGVQPRTN